MALYIGINGTPKKVSTLYVGINGTPKKVKTVYTSDDSGTLKKVLRTATVTNTTVTKTSVFTTSGSFKIPSGATNVTAFVVGGGGAGSKGSLFADGYTMVSGNGGGGGYTKTQSINASAGSTISISIGAGGVANGGEGGTTTVGSISANGGTVLNGGSAGGCGGAHAYGFPNFGENSWDSTNGASNGGNTIGKYWNFYNEDEPIRYNSSLDKKGTGQGTTTIFNGTWYSGGGGGGKWQFNRGGRSGGAGGGGNGGVVDSNGGLVYSAESGSANTGGGGGGGGSYNETDHPGANGGSGVAIIKWNETQTSITWS